MPTPEEQTIADLREQLARALNVANMWLVRRSSGGNVVLW
jgi:hypothetical protein